MNHFFSESLAPSRSYFTRVNDCILTETSIVNYPDTGTDEELTKQQRSGGGKAEYGVVAELPHVRSRTSISRDKRLSGVSRGRVYDEAFVKQCNVLPAEQATLLRMELAHRENLSPIN